MFQTESTGGLHLNKLFRNYCELDYAKPPRMAPRCCQKNKTRRLEVLLHQVRLAEHNDWDSQW